MTNKRLNHLIEAGEKHSLIKRALELLQLTAEEVWRLENARGGVNPALLKRLRENLRETSHLLLQQNERIADGKKVTTSDLISISIGSATIDIQNSLRFMIDDLESR